MRLPWYLLFVPVFAGLAVAVFQEWWTERDAEWLILTVAYLAAGAAVMAVAWWRRREESDR